MPPNTWTPSDGPNTLVAAVGRSASNVMSSTSFKTAVTATLSVREWAQAITFYRGAFGASPENLNFSPESLGGCSVRMLLVVEDPAAVCTQAVAEGATQVSPVADAYGWRLGCIVDPFGHHWEIGRRLM